jgi:hypothetical protein
MANVLVPVPIPSSINIDNIREYLTKYIEPRKEFYNETNRPMYIEDEFSEWWVAKASNGQLISKGREATDVITSQNEGVDAMCVVMNKKQSNEKSLIQNFKESGNDLDIYFKNKEDIPAIKLYADDLKIKLNKLIKSRKLEELYIFAFISTIKTVHVLCFKYNIDLIDSITSEGFTKLGKSINIGGFLDKTIGNVKLYKSKKRIELRLNVSCLTHEYAIQLY